MNKPHRARKRFGQNFLIDQGIIQQIINSIHPLDGDNLLEIGPGQAAITAPLLAQCKKLSVIEIDRDLIAMLQQKFPPESGLTIHEGDALNFDFSQLASEQPDKKLRVVGNLPYNISTPLLFRLLEHKQLVQDMHFMLQKEVVDRLGAVPGQKSYGRLSIMVQYHCQVMPLFIVPPHSFRPAPKVQSAIVRVKPYTENPYPSCDTALLSRVVNQCFQQRRKTLRNCLKPLAANLDELNIDLSLRPEQLSVTQFANITNQIEPL